jgi:predicted type IV restriction endonuclease
MSVAEEVYKLASRVTELRGIIETEEATKTAFITPFIQNVLGYDVTDPREVIPEFTADIGVKRGEKVDYAIKSGQDFRFIIECKKIGEELSLNHASQLLRYSNVTDAEFAILTNGNIYQFYAKLDKAGRMDEKLFMTLNLSAIDERLFPHLEKCTKNAFDAETITAAAEELKYLSEIKSILAADFKNPSEEWVRYLTRQVSKKRLTENTLKQFTRVVQSAAAQFLKDEVNRRLKTAQELETEPAADEIIAPEEPTSEIVTTDDELAAYSIIRAIGCRVVPAEDIYIRDGKTYCAILYQNNNRKPIARLWFNNGQLRLGLFDENKVETKHDISGVVDIYRFADEITARLTFLSS